MVSVDLARVNVTAPYRVEYVAAYDTYQFVTDNEVVYLVAFEADDLLTSGPSYQLSVTNGNKRRSPSDPKVRDTILSLVYEFFVANAAAILYICDTGDNRQASRNRLFLSWYHSSPYWRVVGCMTAAMEDADGVYNYAAMFVRLDNPLWAAYAAEFAETTQLLMQKG